MKQLALFASPEQACSYLPDRQAQLLFIDPHLPEVEMQMQYHNLIQKGFRRTGDLIYRPGCAHCNECQPSRIPVQSFKPNRTQRRVWNKNKDLQIQKVRPTAKEETLALYRAYQFARHPKEEEIEPSDDYLHFLTSRWSDTWFLEFRLQKKLLCVGVIDQTTTGLSAVYTFFDPTQDQRSLGSLAVLTEIELARELDLPYLYLGYWIKDCDKMNYKSRFQPLELLKKGVWAAFNL